MHGTGLNFIQSSCASELNPILKEEAIAHNSGIHHWFHPEERKDRKYLIYSWAFYRLEVC
ncbi:hypothetical protein N9O24_00455 [bacterium]|nr:hypothetical protein [bacterium]